MSANPHANGGMLRKPLRLPDFRDAGAHAKEKLRNIQIECQNYAYENGVDKPEVDQWTWLGSEHSAGATK